MKGTAGFFLREMAVVCVPRVCMLQRRHFRRKLALRKIRKIRSLCGGEASVGCSNPLGAGGIDPAE